MSHYDTIIIGAGTAGMPTAIFAAQRGGLLLQDALQAGSARRVSTPVR